MQIVHNDYIQIPTRNTSSRTRIEFSYPANADPECVIKDIERMRSDLKQRDVVIDWYTFTVIAREIRRGIVSGVIDNVAFRSTYDGTAAKRHLTVYVHR